jgi:hypothetical protein
MKNLKKIPGKALRGLALILLVAGCVDIIKAPPAAPNPAEPEEGQIVVTIGSGPERTLFPRIDQFSKIMLSFERKDGAGSKEDEEVSLGETLINLSPGAWEITAAAYNEADPPAVVARAVNTLTRAGDQITGDTYFALAPAGTGPGILRYRVARPAGIALDAAQSRMQIEQEGVVLDSLNSDSFVAGIRPISGAVNGSLSLEPGRYAVDIVLADNASVNTAVYRSAVAVLPGLVTELVFTPGVGDFLDPDSRMALTGAATFVRTSWNTSGTVIGAAGGEGENRTRGISVAKKTRTMCFILGKSLSQTIVLDAAATDKVSWTESGTVDGSAAGGTRAVFTVDTGDLAEAGGDRVFAFSLEEPGKTPLTYTVTVTVPHVIKIVINRLPEKLLYMQGISLDLRGMELTGTWSDLTTAPLTIDEIGISGFDSTQTGGQRLRVVKNGVLSDNDFTVTVVERRESRLFFYYDWPIEYGPSPRPYYTVPQGRTVVLAPVLYLIPDNAVYEWKVDDAVQNGYDTEYFPYTGTESSGTHTVTVTAKVEGLPIASADTTVHCTGGASQRSILPQSQAKATRHGGGISAPVQDLNIPSDLHGAGGFGGTVVFKFDHSIPKRGVNAEELTIGGNAFGGWEEPGVIWVSQDDNNNGEPDDTWYELRGSHTLAPETIRRYAVTFREDHTWLDNFGGGGTYPQIQKWRESAGRTEKTLVGTRLYFPVPPLWGYADVVDNQRVSLSNAIQADNSPIDLPFIDFVKSVTALHIADTTFGERSTETRTPADRFMPDPYKRIEGKDLENGAYEYSFTNNSGYSLTVEFDGTSFTLAANGGKVVKTSTNSVEYIDYYGGSVSLYRSAGQATFNDG